MTRREPPRLRVVGAADAPSVARPNVIRNLGTSISQPWLTPIGSTRNMLGFVPGATLSKLEQWQLGGMVELHQNSPGRGARVERVASDVLQIATFAELSALGVPLHTAKHVWMTVVERAWFGRGAHGVALYAGPDNSIVVRDYGVEGPTGAPLPDAVVLFRIAPFISRIAKLIGIREVIAS